jgi:TPR repeat protein
MLSQRRPGIWAVVLLAWASGCAGDVGPRPRADWGPVDRELERRCQGGDWPACGELGRSLLGPGRTQKDRERALVLLEATCGHEDVPACTALGRTYGLHFRDRDASARARQLLAWGCERRSAVACTGLGRLAQVGEEPPAKERYRLGCELGDGEGCELLAQDEREAFGGDRGRAREAYQRACQLGRLSSCQLLARDQIESDETRADGVALLVATCKRGHRPSCFEAAELFAPLVSDRPDCDAARPLAEAACRAGEREACPILDACLPGGGPVARHAAACEKGYGMACLYWAEAQPAGTADPEQLRRAYRAACMGNTGPRASLIACGRGAALDLATAHTQEHGTHALHDLDEACEASSGQACCDLSTAFRRGIWTLIDLPRAERLRAKACQLGERRCCVTPPDRK